LLKFIVWLRKQSGIGLAPEVTAFFFDAFKTIYKNFAKKIRIIG
jgi:hypothetical protein